MSIRCKKCKQRLQDIYSDCRYCVKVEKLEKKVEHLKSQLHKTLADDFNKSKKIDKLKEALEFYANESDVFEGYDLLDDFSYVESGNMRLEVLGKRARQALKEIDNE